MAQKRMFDRNITSSDDFFDLSIEAQLLYFQIGMYADDDGLTKAYRTLMKLIKASNEDLKSLIDNGFIYKFDSDVIAIKHWRINNTIRNDRYRPTIFKKEKSQLGIAENNEYILLDTSGIPDDNQMDTQNSIDKISIDKNRLEKKSKEKNSLVEEREEYLILSEKDVIVKDIIDYLNKRVKSSYNWENIDIKRLIYDLIEKGYKKIDFQVVIDKKYDEWHDSKMVVHLNPYVLFGKYFEKYLNQPVIKKTLNDISMEEINEMLEMERQSGIVHNTLDKMTENE